MAPAPRIDEPLFENISPPTDMLSAAMQATLFSDDPLLPEGDVPDMPMFQNMQPVESEILDRYLEEDAERNFNAQIFAELEVPEVGEEVEIME